jgi:hypothetical protein
MQPIKQEISPNFFLSQHEIVETPGLGASGAVMTLGSVYYFCFPTKKCMSLFLALRSPSFLCSLLITIIFLHSLSFSAHLPLAFHYREFIKNVFY